MVFEKSINLHFLFSIQTDLHDTQSFGKSTKTVYAELSELSKKAIDYAIKANMQHELSNALKKLIHDIQNKINENENGNENENLADINNPPVIKHKGRPPKRLKASVESKGKQVLKDSTQVNIMDGNEEL